MAVSNTKLLDMPGSVCERVEVHAYPETWDEFDRIVLWLIKNGVMLGVRDKNDYLKKHRVVTKGKHPYADGKMLNHGIGARGYIDGEESGIRYEVLMPDDIRR